MVQIRHQLAQAGGQPLRAHEHRCQLGQQKVHPCFPPVPSVEIDHLAGRTVAHHVGGGEAERGDGRGVEEPLVAGSLPHGDRPGGADRIESRPVHQPVPELVIAPGKQPLARIGQVAVGGHQPPGVLVGGVGGREGLARQHPILVGDHLGVQRGGTQDRVQVLIDQARTDHRVGERVIDSAGVAQVLGIPDGHDPSTRHRHRRGLGDGRVHGDHPAGEKHRCRLFGHGTGLCPAHQDHRR